jgi:hypothetical protein
MIIIVAITDEQTMEGMTLMLAVKGITLVTSGVMVVLSHLGATVETTTPTTNQHIGAGLTSGEGQGRIPR